MENTQSFLCYAYIINKHSDNSRFVKTMLIEADSFESARSKFTQLLRNVYDDYNVYDVNIREAL